MNPFVSFQVMIAVETLRALVALERALVMRGLLRPVHLMHLRAVPAVEACHHAARHAARKAVVGDGADHGHLATRAVHIGHDGTRHAGTIKGR